MYWVLALSGGPRHALGSNERFRGKPTRTTLSWLYIALQYNAPDRNAESSIGQFTYAPEVWILAKLQQEVGGRVTVAIGKRYI